MGLASFDSKQMLDVMFEPDGNGFFFYPNRRSKGVRVTAAERASYLSAPPLEAIAMGREFAKRPSAGVRRSRRHVRRRFNLAEPKAHAAFRLTFALLLGAAAVSSSAFWAVMFGCGAVYLSVRAVEVLVDRHRAGGSLHQTY